MQSKKIQNTDIEALKISSLPTRPTASTAFGGKGFTSVEMKAAFDKLPLFIIEKFNLLIDDLSKEGKDSFVGSMKTEITSEHTLYDMLGDIISGRFAEYLMINGKSLSEYLAALEKKIANILDNL